MTSTIDATQFDPSTVDEAKMDELAGRIITDVGGAASAGLVVLGDRLGLYAALARGPATADELAERTGTAALYVAPWLGNQAAGGYVEYDAETGRFWMTPEQTMAFVVEDGPAFFPGAFQLVMALLRDTPSFEERFRTGEGFGWHEHDVDLFEGTARFFRPGYVANLVDSWLPALDGVVDKLRAGADVADWGCGHGVSTILMAQSFERSRFIGSDYHEASIVAARRKAEQAGVGDRVRFEVADASAAPEQDFDLITMFDCLHDMGDPDSAATAARQALRPGGTLMVVEPAAGDRVQDNLNPVGRVYYAGSTLICTPASLSQPGARALGAQAGPAVLTALLREAGFGSVRVAVQTPVNLVIEARP
ncbi:class I SAM-dependent methyltransferase [Angustibacter sp. McL0619]|uniref:class I SAM-dependent methyltransferase n=1 Tax=Angustibacter sp. McL0619 TaxID=3415676 RepID=UPI003CF27D47